jgi:hypothetical protein
VVKGNAVLGDRAQLEGNLTLAGVVQRSPSASIYGTLVEHSQDIQLPPIPSKTFSVGTRSEVIPPGATVVLNPATHGPMTIGSGAKVTFNQGVHKFASLYIDTDARIVIPASVALNVKGNFTLADRSVVQAASPGLLLLYSNGTDLRVGNDAKFAGVAIAPNAYVTIASRSEWAGCVGAKNVDLLPDAFLASHRLTLPTTL